jgi:hypothetical protein
MPCAGFVELSFRGSKMEDAEETCELCDKPFEGGVAVCLRCWNPVAEDRHRLQLQNGDLNIKILQLEAKIKELTEAGSAAMKTATDLADENDKLIKAGVALAGEKREQLRLIGRMQDALEAIWKGTMESHDPALMSIHGVAGHALSYTEKRKCDKEGPAELRCEREVGHDGPCMGDMSKAYPKRTEVVQKEAAALLDPKSPGWDAGADRLLKELSDRKQSHRHKLESDCRGNAWCSECGATI